MHFTVLAALSSFFFCFHPDTSTNPACDRCLPVHNHLRWSLSSLSVSPLNKRQMSAAVCCRRETDVKICEFFPGWTQTENAFCSADLLRFTSFEKKSVIGRGCADTMSRSHRTYCTETFKRRHYEMYFCNYDSKVFEPKSF